MTTLRLSLLAILALVVAGVPAFAGTIERFLLPRTIPLRVSEVAATPDWTWASAAAYSYVVAKVAADGTFIDVVNLETHAYSIVADPIDGSLWYANYDHIGHLSLSGEQTLFPLPATSALQNTLQNLSFGPDDHLWFSNGRGLVRMSRSGQVTEYANTNVTGFEEFANGPDGNLWIAYQHDNAIGRMTPSGTLTLFSSSADQSDWPTGIAAADGKLWYNSSFSGLKHITTTGVITAVPNTGSSGGDPEYGLDGRLWWPSVSGLKKFNIATSQVESTYAVPGGDQGIWELSATSNGVWWGTGGNTIGRVTYAGEVISAPFNLLGPEPFAMASSAEHLWFTAPVQNQIGRVNTVDGGTVLFDLPNANSFPRDIVAGTDAMWFTEENGDRIGRIDGYGAIQEFPVPTSGGKPYGIAFGPDGNLWFTLAAADKIVRMTPAGVFTEFPLPGTGREATSITAGPDGNLWFTMRNSDQIGRITLAGVITEFPAGGDVPDAIVAGPDGNLWYSTWATNHRMTPQGVRTGFPTVAGFTWERVVGPDGAIWYIKFEGIARTTLDGTTHRFSISGNVRGRTIATGPDGKIWFSDAVGQSLFRLTPDEPMTAIGYEICPHPQSGDINDQVVATFIDPDPSRTAADYSATVDWGDGTVPSSTTIVQTAPGTFAVRGSHDYASRSPRNVKITFTALPGPNRIGDTAIAFSTVPGLTVTPSSFSFYKEGGTGTIEVDTDDDCSWSASPGATWITFTNGSGQGPGSFDFTVAPNNTGAERTAGINVGGVNVAITQSAQRDPKSSFYLITPCRLIDTRTNETPLPSGATVMHFAANYCGIPADATSVAANVTVVTPPGSGWLSLYPANMAWPGVSTVNYRTGRTRANNTFITLNDGAFNVLNVGAPVHYLIDVMGYFK